MCHRTTTVAFFVSALLAIASANAQSPGKNDRVIAGSGNLSIFAKMAHSDDHNLLNALRSDTLNCLVICQGSVKPKNDEPPTTEYYVLYANGRRTRFSKKVIQKNDYDAFIKVADNVHRD